MEVIFAPWRLEYILADKGGKGCIFCQMASSRDEKEALVLHKTQHSIVAMNKYPYNNGHLMVAPKRHIPDLLSLSDAELLDLFATVQLCQAVLSERMRPDGFNIGINIGRTAGAGVDDHIHVHIVPRWEGDSNFMTTVSEVRVIPELLEKTFDRLRPGFVASSTKDEGKA